MNKFIELDDFATVALEGRTGQTRRLFFGREKRHFRDGYIGTKHPGSKRIPQHHREAELIGTAYDGPYEGNTWRVTTSVLRSAPGWRKARLARMQAFHEQHTGPSA